MDASPEDLLQLLELQKVDSAMDRLNARLRNLAEQQELDLLSDRQIAVRGSAGELQAESDHLAHRLGRLENDVDSLERKIAMEQQRLNSGDVGNPRELAALSNEIEALHRRKSRLEDDSLVVMEELEAVNSRLAEATEDFVALGSQIFATKLRRDVASAEVARELEAAAPRREHWAGRIAPDLLGIYGELRKAKGGVGAALLEGSTCLGCHMKLPAQEVERLRKTSGVARCEECGRILVVPGG